MAYEDAIYVLNTKPLKVESKPDAATKQEDYMGRLGQSGFSCFKG